MFRFLFITILCVFNLSSAEASDRVEIEDFFSDLTGAFNNHDLNTIEDSWSNDGELFTLAGGVYKGRKDIRALFNDAFASPYKTAKYDHFIQYVRLKGTNSAVVDGVWKVTGGPPNYPSCGIFLYTLSKNANRWSIDVSYSSVPREGHTAEHGRVLSWVKICNE